MSRVRGSWNPPLLAGALVLAPLCAALANETALDGGEAPSFRRDVVAVLSRAGCNRGVCHGNKNGKGGFKLSLRGEDPELDLAALVGDLFGRRVAREDPGLSLIILKPTAQVPHEGGRRFEIGSLEHRILDRWVARGCPPDAAGLPPLARLEVAPREVLLSESEDRFTLRAEAVFADGARRDVTRLAVFESVEELAAAGEDGVVVMPRAGEATLLVRYLGLQETVRIARVAARPGFAWKEVPEASFIDRHVFSRLRALRIEPSALCADGEFARRAYLDLLGLLPPAQEARDFVADRDPEKRLKLVDRLLERPEFADFWALKWSDLLRNEEKVLDRKGVQAFHDWIRRGIESGKPLDRFARELIAARGSTYARPEANFYRALRDPVTRAESAAQLFLGVNIGCAKCHSHPFERWTQDDYYGFAAFFARVRYKVIENRRQDQNDGHEFQGEQVVWLDREGEVVDPRTQKPAAPRFLGAPATEVGERDRLEALADWAASPENPFFARVLANRIWAWLMGRGLVEPVDDFRASNPPSHPELLDALAAELVAGGFDLRRLVRTIMGSRAYQLSAKPTPSNLEDESHFARARVVRLGAEQLLDAFCQVSGGGASFNGYPPGTRAAQIAGVQAARARDRSAAAGDSFLRLFGRPPRLLSCECERSSEPSVAQAFQLLSGELVGGLLEQPENHLAGWLASSLDAREMVEELCWSALSRAPSARELDALAAHIEGAGPDGRRAALEDAFWSILNSKEFLFRH
jgi:hypothetical protein